MNLIVMQLNVPSAKNAERFVGALRRMGIEASKIKIVVNRFVKKGWDIEPEEVERALGLKISWMVPNDFKNAIAAINYGEPVVLRAPRSGDEHEPDRAWRRSLQREAATAARRPDDASTDRRARRGGNRWVCSPKINDRPRRRAEPQLGRRRARTASPTAVADAAGRAVGRRRASAARRRSRSRAAADRAADVPPAAEGPHPPAAGRAARRAEPTHAAAGHRPQRSPHPHPRAVPERKGPAQQRRAGTADGRGDGRDLRPRPARDAAEGPDDHRHPGQPLRPHLRRAQGPARADRRPLPRQRAPAADHRPHRRPGRPARRRDQPDGRRPPRRRQPRQRDHPAAGAGRPGDVDSPLRHASRCSSKT